MPKSGEQPQVHGIESRLEEADRPRYRVFLDEAVLYRGIGGPAVMAAQLDKVRAAERQGKVTFQIIPFDLGAHAAQDSDFVFFEFEERSGSSPVVFVEALTGNHYLEKAADIGRYREAIEYLRDTALSPRDSVRHMTEIKGIYNSGRYPIAVAVPAPLS